MTYSSFSPNCSPKAASDKNWRFCRTISFFSLLVSTAPYRIRLSFKRTNGKKSGCSFCNLLSSNPLLWFPYSLYSINTPFKHKKNSFQNGKSFLRFIVVNDLETITQNVRHTSLRRYDPDQVLRVSAPSKRLDDAHSQRNAPPAFIYKIYITYCTSLFAIVNVSSASSFYRISEI